LNLQSTACCTRRRAGLNSAAAAGEEGTPAAEESARLALTGAYRPPLGRLAAGLDQVVLHRVATATMRALLGSVAETITASATAGQAAEETSPGVRPILEPGMP
jgi:hypothetical protein